MKCVQVSSHRTHSAVPRARARGRRGLEVIDPLVSPAGARAGSAPCGARVVRASD